MSNEPGADAKRAAALALAFAIGLYFGLSAICLWWPSLLEAVVVSLPSSVGLVVAVLIAPPGLLTAGSGALSIYGWWTATLGITTGLTFAGWWTDGGSVLVCFWGLLSVVVWVGVFFLHLMAAA